MKDRLKEYIEKDEIYQEYKNGKLTNASDFDKFCIQHCKDIEELLEENEELKSQLKGTTHCYDEVEHRQLKEQQQEFIKYLKEKEKQFDMIDDPINSGACCGILTKYKEIIGEK